MKKIYQRDFKDCGATCLSYIIQYYKGYVPLERLREDTYTADQGCTAYDLVEALKKYHFDAIGLRITKKDFSSLYLPAIAHLVLENGLLHFVVIIKITPKNIIIMDPALGKVKYSYPKFQKVFDGVVILAIPKTEIMKLPKEKNILKTLGEMMTKEKRFFKKIIFFNLIVIFLSLLSSFYLKIGLNGMLRFSNGRAFFLFTSSFGLMLLIKFILTYGKDKLRLYLNKNIEVSFLYSFLTHLFKIPLRKLNTYQEGELLTRIEEVEEIKTLFTDICITFFLETILAILSLFLLSFLNFSLFLILIMGMACYLLLGLASAKVIFRLVLKRLKNEAAWKSNLLENIRIMSTMKHLNAYESRKEKMEEALCQNVELKLKQDKKLLCLQAMKEYFLDALFFVITTYGLLQIAHQNFALIDFLTFQNLYVYFVAPLKEFVDMIPKLCYMKGILIKISEFAALKEEDVENEETLLYQGDLKFNHVSFAYQPLWPNLSDLSFSIRAKEHVFLKGDSGVGKSTICKLLIREVEDYQGDILLGSYHLKDLSLSKIRGNIVYLSQNEFVLYETIKENILFGRVITDPKFLEVCEFCKITEIVKNKPLRYESMVDSSSLSGGERQRIILARTLLQKASIYLFDECLSEVEEKSEKEIIKGLRSYLRDKMVIYISHRTNGKLFDRVIEIENKQLSPS